MMLLTKCHGVKKRMLTNHLVKTAEYIEMFLSVLSIQQTLEYQLKFICVFCTVHGALYTSMKTSIHLSLSSSHDISMYLVNNYFLLV